MVLHTWHTLPWEKCLLPALPKKLGVSSIPLPPVHLFDLHYSELLFIDCVVQEGLCLNVVDYICTLFPLLLVAFG